jgi:outer membrane protein TolC
MKNLLYFVFLTHFISYGQLTVRIDSVSTLNKIALSNTQYSNQTITLSEFIGYIKKFHPIVKQANLIVLDSDLKRLKAKGVFDPKLELDYTTKQFQSKEYYEKLNASFKIPVWYGIDFKANYENNQGLYLNPENSTPSDGLFAFGITASIGNGMLINTRMAAIKQAENFQKQALEERKILVNTILFNAANSYFDWLQDYKEMKIHKSFLSNADMQFNAVKRSFKAGEVAAIDTLEANITLINRKLNLEKASIELSKSALQLSNFLWLENNIPVELQKGIIPDILTINTVDLSLQTPNLTIDSIVYKEHPKLKSLEYKIENLKIDRKLKNNQLLPKIEAQYNFITESSSLEPNLNSENFKAGLKVSIPVFLRKERADVRLTKLKIEAVNYEKMTQRVMITNKINALKKELISYEKQLGHLNLLVKDYKTLSDAEFRKFNLGESSVFYVNIRESKLIQAELKYVALINTYLKTKAKLFNSLVVY